MNLAVYVYFFSVADSLLLLYIASPQEAHVALAFQGASWTSEYSYPLMVMQTILGSWDRSSAAGRNVSSK